jgi:hypothetical protein
VVAVVHKTLPVAVVVAELFIMVPIQSLREIVIPLLWGVAAAEVRAQSMQDKTAAIVNSTD